MMVENKRDKGSGSVWQRSSDNRWIGRVPNSVPGPPRYVSALTEEEANRLLDLRISEVTAHTIYLPVKLGEDATAKAAEMDTTLSEVVLPTIEAFVQRDSEQDKQ